MLRPTCPSIHLRWLTAFPLMSIQKKSPKRFRLDSKANCVMLNDFYFQRNCFSHSPPFPKTTTNCCWQCIILCGSAHNKGFSFTSSRFFWGKKLNLLFFPSIRLSFFFPIYKRRRFKSNKHQKIILTNGAKRLTVCVVLHNGGILNSRAIRRRLFYNQRMEIDGKVLAY